MNVLHIAVRSLITLAITLPWSNRLRAAEHGDVPRFHVAEVTFVGPKVGPSDTPARDVELAVSFRHESGEPTVRVYGFWDGDGKGGDRGNVFKVRFCPTRVGRWRIVETTSNRAELKRQRLGDSLLCIASTHSGFWIAAGRWYKRSDGSHPFIIGNTHYSFLSRRNDKGPVNTSPLDDMRSNARFYKKLRFSLFGDRYPDPKQKPFLDDRGQQTDDGRHSVRPNPSWFQQRVDPAIRAGFEHDLICDLILCGPDTRQSRSTLAGDPKPWLRYVAARYGAYPNVWFCLANEWNIKQPSYTAKQIRAAGDVIRSFLPNPTPISVHSNRGKWNTALNGSWHDHVIIQNKLKRLPEAADATAGNHRRGGIKPVCNDENGYQGRGDGFTKEDVIEGCFGTFLGGGYPTTGEKYGRKLGQYFWGGFDAKAHSATRHLAYLRNYIDRSIEFWNLKPVRLSESIFAGIDRQCRLLGGDDEFALGSNRRIKNHQVKLPDGTWRITQLDLIAMTTKTLGKAITGDFAFRTPNSRAVLTHFKRISSESPRE